ncbi:SufBD protein [Sphingomonas sp. Leaf17]|uniref:SufD family Fe-S cluster assembly protein n=1 Tax=Sphingomonas sp. Leaf17 TaxID=1735683 RepID=UPI0006FBB1A6|nr:SufD family Fe-S cluster assembly protein [Sphingomonas sp. Leaf17]KQM67761.1 SufBD protein [Sphingomonas sp. Leaf17]
MIVLPDTRVEAWRWADPAAITAAAALPTTAAADTDALFLDLPGIRLLVIDGVPQREGLPPAAGVTFVTFDGGDHVLGAQAAGSGWRLDVAVGSTNDPVQVVHVATGGSNHLPAGIVLGDGATAQVVETYVGTGWSNRLTRVTLGKGARLMRAVRLLQTEGFVSLREEVTLAEDANLVTTMLGAGDAGTRVDAAITLAGNAGIAEYGGALLTRAEQKQECAVRVRHAAPNGQSHQLWRAVAADRSTASLAAAVEVARDAQKTDGEQSLRGLLLLQRTATVNLKPELEIFADDVKCAHGATVGELDAKALFYMQSRGIAPARAQALLTRAFVGDALSRIEDETVRVAFEADADAWLDRALGGAGAA